MNSLSATDGGFRVPPDDWLMFKTHRRIWLMFLVALIVGLVLVVPYLLLDINSSRLEVHSETHYYLLVTHIFTAFVALVLGPLQFIPAIRAKRKVHRVIGRTYLLAGVLPSALAGIPVALLSERLITQIGLLIPAVGWLITGWLAYRAARDRRFAEHRAWMIRNYALTFLAVTARAVVPVLILVQLPFAGAGAVEELAASTIPIGQSLGWIINLIFAEFLIRKRFRGYP